MLTFSPSQTTPGCKWCTSDFQTPFNCYIVPGADCCSKCVKDKKKCSLLLSATAEPVAKRVKIAAVGSAASEPKSSPPSALLRLRKSSLSFSTFLLNFSPSSSSQRHRLFLFSRVLIPTSRSFTFQESRQVTSPIDAPSVPSRNAE